MRRKSRVKKKTAANKKKHVGKGERECHLGSINEISCYLRFIVFHVYIKFAAQLFFALCFSNFTSDEEERRKRIFFVAQR